MTEQQQTFPTTAFTDVLQGNGAYATGFDHADLPPGAGRGLLVLTCMDSRLDPLGILGLQIGDAKVLRNAGGRVTDEVLRIVVMSSYLLRVRRVLVMPHTTCAMSSRSESQFHAEILASYGVDTRSVDFGAVPDQQAALAHDLVRLRTHPLLPKDLVAAGAVYDVTTGRLVPQDL